MPDAEMIAVGVRRVRFGLVVVGGLLVAVQTANGQTPPAGGYELYTLGLTGNGYEHAITGGIYRSSTANALNAAGQAVGYSTRWDASGNALGWDAWMWDGTTTRQIGLTGPGYEFANMAIGGETYRVSTASALNDAGQAVGYSIHFNAAGANLGNDAWLWTGSTTLPIGLTGPGYEYANTGTGSGMVRSSIPTDLNAAGQAVGFSNRYDAGRGLGIDAWLWTGSTTLPIGLTGTGYEYANTGTGGGTYRSSRASALNAAGQAIGFSTRYNASGSSIGQDAWLWDGSTARQIGLTGPEYEYAFTGTGGGTYRSSTPAAINDVGQAVGTSNRYNASGTVVTGTDAWMWNGSTTRQIGLTGTGYEYTDPATGETWRTSTPSAINDAGQAVGFSSRYTDGGDSVGQDAWVWDGSSVRQIGLTGPGYETANTGTDGGTSRSSTPTAINDAGQAAGYSSRYSDDGGFLGRDAWFYDPVSATTVPLRFSSSSTDGFSNSQAEVLTDDGVVLGRYHLYSGSTDLGLRAFWWSEASGFYDLGALVNGDLTTDGWQDLTEVLLANGPAGFSPAPGGSPWYILATGRATGQVGGSSVYLFAAVPEPTGGAMLLLAAGGLLARRRRVADAHPAAN